MPEPIEFSVQFNGVTPVALGYEWSYTITKIGAEHDLDQFILQLKDCDSIHGTLPCSDGKCEIAMAECHDDESDCEHFKGVKFEHLPTGQTSVNVTFILPNVTGISKGCYHLKYGSKKLCGNVEVPDCKNENQCPSCPEHSLRIKQRFTDCIQIPESACLDLKNQEENHYLCLDKIRMIEDQCEQPIEVITCANTPSEQTLTCAIPVDFLQLKGKLEVVWQFFCELNSVCSIDQVPLSFLATTCVDIDELCYFCAGEMPDFDLEDVCHWFNVEFVNLSKDGKLTYTVEFTGCSK